MSASLSPAAETARYIDGLGPEALATAQAYTIGNHWLLVGSVLVSIVTAVIMIRLGLLDRLARKL